MGIQRFAVTLIALLATWIASPCAMAYDAPLNQSASSVGQSDPRLAVRGWVDAILPLPDGSAILGGNFGAINGEPRSALARRTAEGNLDETWRPQMNAQVRALAVDSKGRIYAAGESGSDPDPAIVRILPDGSIDESWALVPGGSVFTLAVHGPHLYIGGNFSTATPVPMRNLVRSDLDSSGVIDEAWSPQPDRAVRSVSVGSDGQVFVGGEFTAIGGASRHRLAKLSGIDGEAAADWTVSVDDVVETVLALDDGALLVGGWFNSANGEPRQGIARIDSSGNVDLTWQSSMALSGVLSIARGPGLTFEGAGFGAGTGAAGIAFRLDSQGAPIDPYREFSSSVGVVRSSVAGDVLVGGRFRIVDGHMRLGFVAFDAAGVLRPALDAEVPGVVHAVAVQPNGGVVIGGEFEKAGNMPRQNLARLRPDGGVDDTWNPGANGIVSDLAVDGDESVYVAGLFTSVGGLSKFRFAKLSASGSGTADPSWGGVTGSITDLSVDVEGRVYVAGDMSSVNGQPISAIARFSRSGEFDGQWNPPRAATARAISPVIGGAIYVSYSVAGSLIGGELRKVSVVDGASMGDPLTTDAPPRGVVPSPEGIYVFGPFTRVGLHTRMGAARLALDGIVDAGWVPKFEGQITGLVVGDDGRVYLSGRMLFGEEPYLRLASFSGVDGALLAGWSPQADWHVNGLKRGAEGQIYAFGEFTRVDDAPRWGFAAIDRDEAIFRNGFDGN